MSAQRDIEAGKEYPYHGKQPSDWAEAAALGILWDLSDRGGIKHVLAHVDEGVRVEIVEHMAGVIRTAKRLDDASGTHK